MVENQNGSEYAMTLRHLMKRRHFCHTQKYLFVYTSEICQNVILTLVSSFCMCLHIYLYTTVGCWGTN